ncbi:MAG: RNA methyltransferase [Gemmataceae bacterium]
MLSKSQIRFVKALHQKKHRKEQGLFLVEGSKSIAEFAQSKYWIHSIYHTCEAVLKLGDAPQNPKLQEITHDELRKISTLSTPNDAVAIFHIPETTHIRPESLKGRFVLVLDGVQDPGNLGTIIRTADWFGFTEILCSPDTVEAYSPKVVQASMGSLSRMNVHYEHLEGILGDSTMPVFGALLDGKSIYDAPFGGEGFIVLGNEGSGISETVKSLITTAVTIPRFGKAESLNVAISAAIICSELKRDRTRLGR